MNTLPPDTLVANSLDRIEFSLTPADALLVATSLGIRAQVIEHATTGAGARTPMLRNRANALRHLQDQITIAVKGDAA